MAAQDLIDVPRRTDGPRLDRRRILALSCLVLGLVAAWLHGKDDRAEVQVSLLLTHAEVQIDQLTLGHDRLQEVVLEAPDSDPQASPAWSHSFVFQTGAVPKVTSLQTFALSEGVEHLDIRCSFRLGANAAPVRTHSRVAVDRQRDDIQVIDIGRCTSPTSAPP